jgi:hypothetical protein
VTVTVEIGIVAIDVRTAAVLVYAIVAKIHRGRVDVGPEVIAVLATRLGTVVAVPVHVAQVAAVAVLVHAVVRDFGGAGVARPVHVVAVVTACLFCDGAIAIHVDQVFAIAILIDAIVRCFGRARVDAIVSVVAIDVLLRTVGIGIVEGDLLAAPGRMEGQKECEAGRHQVPSTR